MLSPETPARLRPQTGFGAAVTFCAARRTKVQRRFFAKARPEAVMKVIRQSDIKAFGIDLALKNINVGEMHF